MRARPTGNGADETGGVPLARPGTGRGGSDRRGCGNRSRGGWLPQPLAPLLKGLAAESRNNAFTRFGCESLSAKSRFRSAKPEFASVVAPPEIVVAGIEREAAFDRDCQTRNLQNSGQLDARSLSARGSFGRRGNRTTAGRLSFAFPVFLVGISVAFFRCRWKRA